MLPLLVEMNDGWGQCHLRLSWARRAVPRLVMAYDEGQRDGAHYSMLKTPRKKNMTTYYSGMFYPMLSIYHVTIKMIKV